MEIQLIRGGRVESSHRVHAAVVDESEHLMAWSGSPEFKTFVRSAAKPFQVLPLVEEGGVEQWGVVPEEVALACGSHGGEIPHLARVRSLLARVDVEESALACGPHLPMHEESAQALLQAGETALPIHNNCSGKHAGMLALARTMGWSLDAYHRSGHPVQERMVDEVARWTEVPPDRILRGIDGCGVVCFGLPLRAMARGWGRFSRAASRGSEGPELVLGAMARHPFQVAGTGRLCTRVMEVTDGRIVVKLGAEGVYCGVDRSTGVALALKVEDGSRRACEVALVEILCQMELLDPEEEGSLASWRRREVLNTLGEEAACLQAQGVLESGSATGSSVIPDWYRGDAESSALDPSTRALIRVSGAVASRDRERLKAALTHAQETAAPEWVEEVLVQSYLFVGFPGALNALALWRKVSGREAPEPRPPESPEELERRGEEVCRRVYGEQYEGLRQNIGRLHPDLDRWMVQEGYGKTLGRGGLDLRTRELCVAALLAVLDHPVQLYSHLRGALSVGAEVREVEGMLTEVEPLASPAAAQRMLEVWRRLRARSGEPDSRPTGDTSSRRRESGDVR